MKGFEEMDLNAENSERKESHSRRHNSQIIRDRQWIPMRVKLLNRTTTIWNFLPSEIVQAGNVMQFKARIDRHMESSNWRRSVYRPQIKDEQPSGCKLIKCSIINCSHTSSVTA